MPKKTKTELEQEVVLLQNALAEAKDQIVKAHEPTATMSLRLPLSLLNFVDQHAPVAEGGRKRGTPNRTAYIKSLIERERDALKGQEDA